MSAVEVHNIHKSFEKTEALHQVSFSVEKGELFGIIGPDGAGKTTLFRILTTLLLADNGTASVLGNDVVKDYKTIRRISGYMPGRFSLYQDLSVEENLGFFATIFGTTIKENYELIKDIYVQIEPFKKRRAGALSGGMKQKLALCCALIHKPDILFLDEPTTGVDPVSRKEFWEMLGRLKQQGITILVSTPYMDEAALCDRVTLIQEGRLLGMDTPDALRKRFSHPLLAISADNPYQLLKDLRKYEYAQVVNAFGDSLHYVDNRKHISQKDMDAITQYLAQQGHANISVAPAEAGIEDYFMEQMEKHTTHGAE